MELHTAFCVIMTHTRKHRPAQEDRFSLPVTFDVEYNISEKLATAVLAVIGMYF